MFKKLIFTTTSGERQVYVTRESVTEEQLSSGDDRGVICLCIDEDKASEIARLLTNHASAGGRV